MRIRDDVMEVVPTETTGPFWCAGAQIGWCGNTAERCSFYRGAVALITSSQSEARGASP